VGVGVDVGVRVRLLPVPSNAAIRQLQRQVGPAGLQKAARDLGRRQAGGQMHIVGTLADIIVNIGDQLAEGTGLPHFLGHLPVLLSLIPTTVRRGSFFPST
jgi:hypothetical protein